MASKDDVLAFLGYIEEAAKAATPGEWLVGTSPTEDMARVERVVLPKHGTGFIVVARETTRQTVADTRFIALCSPYNMLKLAEEVRKLLQ